MYKKILVTGGAGFLGSHLCNRLINEGNDVVCLDNLFTGTKNNIKHLLNNSNFEFIRHDITLPIDIYNIDEIYNLACPASPQRYQFDPVQTTKTSFLGALNMLKLARKMNIPILQASTSEIYGDPDISPQVESYHGNVNTLGIRACYDEGKRVAETLFMDYHRQYNVQTRIVRIFNTYGPNMSVGDGRVVSNFIVQALKNENITVYGKGNQTRSFCYVDDLIEGIIRTMSVGETMPINLGNPVERTILTTAELILNKVNSKSKIVFKDLPEDDPKQRKPDITRANNILDWSPKIDFENGLTETINYFKGIIK